MVKMTPEILARERAYHTGRRSPGAAYDSAIGADPMKAVLDYLTGKLSADDIMKVKGILEGASEAAMDTPPDFPGRPRVGGSMTGMDRLPVAIQRQVIDAVIATRDAREKAFASRFPEAARIGVVA